jgi:DNA invertase Pin-like site-specific DNA recombinase
MNKKLTVLYQRLSKDDLNAPNGESGSITNQRDMLVKYAEQNGFTPYICLSDDGRTGTNFLRPGWEQLMELVETDKVGAIILKSLDRMGRNYLEAGMLREAFTDKGIRLIAINDGVDTFDHPDDFIPFREIMAEYYARDTSRKIKSVLKNKGRDGKPLSNIPPYGFIKDPNDKNKWLIDDGGSADVVRRIYRLTIDGSGPYEIARILFEDKVERPSYYQATRGRGSNQSDCDYDNPYAWNGRTVIELIAKPEYAGHTVNFRTNKQSFKSKKITKTDTSEWQIFENTHPAIVPQETRDLAQKLRETKRRTNGAGESNPLTGLLFCHECKRKMYHHHTKKLRHYVTVNGEERAREQKGFYKCSSQSLSRQKFNPACTPHQISVSAVMEIILSVLRRTTGYVREHEAEFVARVRESSALKQGETVKAHKKALAGNERRLAELDKILRSLYEDKALGKITEERYNEYADGYDRECAELREKTAVLQAELEAWGADSENAGKFVELVRRYTNFEELTTAVINEFIDRIEVYEGEYPDAEPAIGYRGTRTQKVDVYLKYIGKFDTPELSGEQLEEKAGLSLSEKEKLQRKREQHCLSERRRRERRRQEKVAALAAEALAETQTSTA